MSKKTLISAITAALVVGAASTTFAAANPFSDVPSDSWAYDAVSTLAADGVIDGYPDGTYQGNNTMTRYEMAQIVARAMAKTDIDKADKAIVDKLAAEFSDELDNLGVRVADLEKKSDNVVWKGKVKYKYVDENHDAGKDKLTNKVTFRLEPKAYIGNSGWTANARIDYDLNLSTSSNGDGEISRAWVEGPLFGGTVQAGKVPLFTAQGMIIDDPFSGATVSWGSDKLNATFMAGRYNHEHDLPGDKETNRDVTAEYYGTQIDYTPNDKLALNAGYTALQNLEQHDVPVSDDFKDDSLGIWYVGGSYAFDKNVKLVGQYAKSDADNYENAGIVELDYKGAKKSDPGSWGAYVGYRHLGQNAVIEPTYDDAAADQKGMVFGVQYALAENIIADVEYFTGKDISTDEDADTFFTKVEFSF
ncbi:S-layer homology domain-containing protein [Megamonas hypermegale]|uniref:S-layer homology domain-containing protein n=1 Tax=Megamonas hypermegale TaxID=158847 RepID=UPI0026EFEFEF|nr:S-layer homology domain-containing protein [Megamonas hypermegale]